MRTALKIFIFIFAVLLVFTGCGSKCAWLDLKDPSIAIELPEEYNTPDGMVLHKDYIYLSINNGVHDKYPGCIVRFGKDHKIEKVTDLPPHPETKRALPLGLDFDPDGNIYVADNQTFADALDNKSRLFRVNMKNDKAVSVDVVVEGFVMANAVSYHDGYIYVTETQLDISQHPEAAITSGVYRFSLKELNDLKKHETIHLRKGLNDDHLITTLKTANPHWPVGANGMGFNSKGELFVANFAEASIHKITFDADKNVKANVVFSKGQGMQSTDGFKIDKNDDIYVADFLGNAIHRIDGKTGVVTTLVKNGLTTGAGGDLDAPSEVCIRGTKCYIANIDLNLNGNTHDAPHTISVIELDQ